MPTGTKQPAVPPKPKVAKLQVTQSYHDVHPRREGPPVPPAGESRAFYDAQAEVISVHLDRGALQRVWELIEAEASRTWPTRETMPSARAAVRAAEAFRKAWSHRGAE
jgi:hypothetical protein